MNSPLIIRLADIVISLYEADKNTFLEILVTGSVHRSVVISVYKLLTKDGSMKTIGDLIESDRKILWERAKKLADGRLCNDDCIELSKALHTLDILNEQ